MDFIEIFKAILLDLGIYLGEGVRGDSSSHTDDHIVFEVVPVLNKELRIFFINCNDLNLIFISNTYNDTPLVMLRLSLEDCLDNNSIEFYSMFLKKQLELLP